MSEHVPVLENEVVSAFMEQPRLPLRFFEGTFGRGGHTGILLKKFPRSRVVSFDRDADAVKYGEEKFAEEIRGGRFQIIHDDFRNLGRHDLGLFDGALLDLGVSSPQLDQAERGFSFMHEGPLDMRMNQNQQTTAADIVNESSEKELSDIFFKWGEVRRPNRVVRAIVNDRATEPFKTTRQLAGLIERVERAGAKKGLRGVKKSIHPATPYFMALRIAVNNELDGLETFFEDLHLHLEPGSRLVVITFHSIEDRIAKVAFKAMNKKFGSIVNKKVITASEEELNRNPRARSAKMRIFQMGDHA